MSARIIIVGVPKGGSGKTTTTHILGLALSESGKRVLFIDADPQGNLSTVLGYRHTKNAPTLYTALHEFAYNRKKTLHSTINHMPSGVDLVPATMALNEATEELAAQMEREHFLEKLLAPIKDQYDFILIDTPPSINVLVNNALVVATEILIPIHAEPLGIAGAAMMLSHLQKIFDHELIKHLVIRGGLMTMVNKRTALNSQSSEYARNVFSQFIPLFDEEAERTIRVPESQMFNESILTYLPRDTTTKKIAKTYRSVRDIILEDKMGKPVSELRLPDEFVENVLEMTDKLRELQEEERQINGNEEAL